MKKERGITLISLIITIIIMMILVGVTVTVAINGDVFNKTKEAARETEDAQWKDNLETEMLAMNAEMLASRDYEFKYEDDALTEIFKTLLIEVQKNFELDSKYVVKVSDEDYSILNYEQLYAEGYIDETFNPIRVPCKYDGKDIVLQYDLLVNEETETIKISEVSFVTSKVTIVAKNEPVKATTGGNIKSLTEDGVPIPKGFYYVTGTKDTGVVISDNASDENEPEGNSGNQFVWVPVNVNPTLEIKIDSEMAIQEVKVESTNGYNETINVNSNYYNKKINLTANGVYLISIKYEDGTTEEYIKEINKVYAKFDASYTSLEILALMAGKRADEYLNEVVEEAIKENPEIRKIDILTSLSQGFDEGTVDNALETANVLKYGGFYIGRYEASLTSGIRKGINPTYGKSYEEAKTTVENMYVDKNVYGVTADLPSAAAWDAVGGWLIDTNAKTAKNIYYSSEYWGNYRVKSSNPYQLKTTGSSENYGANNIYDMAGNLEEWTKATNGEEGVHMARGGNYSVIGIQSFSTKSAKGLDEDLNAMNKIGARPMLYIND